MNMHRIINFLKKEISLTAKPWVNKNIQALMRERKKLFKRYCNENNLTLKVKKQAWTSG